jgi:hypothetical protein
VCAHSLSSVDSNGGHVEYCLIFLGHVANEIFVAIYLGLSYFVKDAIDSGFVCL